MGTLSKDSWFHHAKLGIFFHWGIYAVKGIPESWAYFYYGQEVPWATCSKEEYENQINSFTAANYDPAHWAELIKASGARYTVLTSKHHDGVSMWDTKYSDFNIAEKSPAGRDLIGPFSQAVKKAGLKLGIYFSHCDWHHPDFASIHCKNPVWWGDTSPYFSAPEGQPDDYDAWNRFIEFRNNQLDEIMERFQPDLIWFDGNGARTTEEYKMKELRDQLKGWNPNVILNSRCTDYGDYETPEQNFPVHPPKETWELCITLNTSWGYQHWDKLYKTPKQIVRIFTECIGMGGNLLLDVGPKEDGTFDPEPEQILREFGAWIHKNEPAIYDTVRGLPKEYYEGASTLSEDKKALYLFSYDPSVEYIIVKGLKKMPVKATLVATGEQLSITDELRICWIRFNRKNQRDPLADVIKLEFEEPISLVE